MSIEGWYYLHTNGDLIHKRNLPGTAADIRESPFALALWSFDSRNREDAWTILIEALAAGVSSERITELAAKWGCDDDDAGIFADRVGCFLKIDGDAWCATRTDFVDLAEYPAGFGDTCLEAMAELAKELGYKPSKMWGIGFKGLLAGEETA